MLGLDVVPDAGPRVAPRLLPRPRRHALRRRRVRRARPARPLRACRRRRRPRSTSRRGRRRSTRSSAATPERLALIHFGVADDVAAPPRRAAPRAARLGRVGRGRRDRGGVRRVRARASSPTRGEDAPRTTTSRCRSGSRTAGSKRWADKRARLQRRVARHHPVVAGRSATATSACSSRRGRSRTSGRTSRRSRSRSRCSTSAAARPRSASASPPGRSRRWRCSPSAASSATGCRAALVMIGSDIASIAVRTAMGVAARHGARAGLGADRAAGAAAAPRSRSTRPPRTGSCARSSREELLQQANRLLAIARYAAFPLGAAVGGTIVALVGPGTALLFDAGTYAASALLLSRMRVESIARAGAGFVHELREGWSAFVEHTWVWVLVRLDRALLPDHLRAVLRARPVHREALDGRRAARGASSSPARGSARCSAASTGLRLRPRGRPMVATGAALAGRPPSRASCSPSTPTVVAARAGRACCAGFAFALGSVVWDTTLQRKVPPDKLARVAAYALDGRDGLPARRATRSQARSRSAIGMRGLPDDRARAG